MQKLYIFKNILAVVVIFSLTNTVIAQTSADTIRTIDFYQDSLQIEIEKEESARNVWLLGTAAGIIITTAFYVLGDNAYDSYQKAQSSSEVQTYWDRTETFDRAYSYSFALTLSTLIPSLFKQHKINSIADLKQNIPLDTIYQICDSCYLVGKSALMDKEDNLVLSKYQIPEKLNVINIYLQRLHTDGHVFWERHFESGNHERANNIIADRDNGYVIIGQEQFADNINLLMIKTDKDGGLLWKKSFDFAADEKGFGIVELADSGYIVSSNLRFNSSEYHISLTRTDKVGNLLWNKLYKENYNMTGVELLQTGPDRILVCGIILSDNGQNDIVIFSVTNEGEMVWERTIGSEDTKHELNAVSLNHDGNIVLVYEEEQEKFLSELDPDGKVLYQHTIDEKESVQFNQILPLHAGGYAIVGASKSAAVLLITDNEGVPKYRGQYEISGLNQEIFVSESSDRSLIIVGTSKRAISPPNIFMLKTYSFKNTTIN